MLSVFTSHICEELYRRTFARHEGWLSITVAPWPEAGRYDESCIEQGGVLMGAMAAARRAKRDARVPLSARVSEVVVYAGEYAELLERWAQDIAGTLRASRVTARREGGGTHSVEGLPSVSVEVVP